MIYNEEHDVYVVVYARRDDPNFEPRRWKSGYVVVTDARTGAVKLAGPFQR